DVEIRSRARHDVRCLVEPPELGREPRAMRARMAAIERHGDDLALGLLLDAQRVVEAIHPFEAGAEPSLHVARHEVEAGADAALVRLGEDVLGLFERTELDERRAIEHAREQVMPCVTRALEVRRCALRGEVRAPRIALVVTLHEEARDADPAAWPFV